LSGPARRKAIILKRKKIFWVHKKNSDPKKQFFDFYQKQFSGSGSLAHAVWNSEPATPIIPEFFKNRKRSHVDSIGPSAATSCSGECLLVQVKLACGWT
jgi:hypothetical protein